jgi:hypothetical protein
MKKTLLALLSAVLLITVVQPAQAEDQKVLAIIDSAINSNNFPSIIQEAFFGLSNITNTRSNFYSFTPSLQERSSKTSRRLR